MEYNTSFNAHLVVFVCSCILPWKVFYYTDVKFKARKNKDSPGHHILSSQLPPMISSVESKLGEGASAVS